MNTAEVKEAKKHLKRQIKNAESALKDLQTTVTLVESAREKFPQIDDAELYDRQTFVSNSRSRVSKARSEMNSDMVKAKIMTDKKRLTVRRAGDLGAKTDAEKENTAFVVDGRAQAQALMQQQDETLDELNEAVVRVGHMAGAIHEELGEQNKMLTELDDDLADAEEKLGLVMGKLAKMLKTKNRFQPGNHSLSHSYCDHLILLGDLHITGRDAHGGIFPCCCSSRELWMLPVDLNPNSKAFGRKENFPLMPLCDPF